MWLCLGFTARSKVPPPNPQWLKRALAFGLLCGLAYVVPSYPGSAETTEALRSSNGEVLSPLDVFKECDQCPEMIVVPLGSFMMGATQEESRNPFDFFGEGATMTRRAPDAINIIPHEHPRHRVEMDVPYAIGRNEITYAQWNECVDAGGCAHSPDHRVFAKLDSGRLDYVPLEDSHPAINISFLDMLEYVTWLNSLVGGEVYRLPTEAEWEYAARGGSDARFGQGEELTPQQANFSGVGTEQMRGKEMPELTNRRIPVLVNDLSSGNGWGLRHMSGNLYELTLSCWSSEHLGLSSDRKYQKNAQSQSTCERVAKGGSFATGMDYLRPSARASRPEHRRKNDTGFRIVRELK